MRSHCVRDCKNQDGRLSLRAAVLLLLLWCGAAHSQETSVSPASGPATDVPPVSPAPDKAPGNKVPESAKGKDQGNLEQPERTSLLKEQFPGDDWVFFSGKTDATLQQTWRVIIDPETKQPVLICTGDPQGYVRTTATFADFEFGMEWKYPVDQDGNSGVFLFTSGDDRIWPTGLQLQLHQPVAGSAFPSGGGKADNELRNVPMTAKPANQWNECHVVCRDGRVAVTVNGMKLGEVTGCDPRRGAIALQSEGSEIHFRKIWVRDTSTSADGEKLSDLRELEPVDVFVQTDSAVNRRSARSLTRQTRNSELIDYRTLNCEPGKGEFINNEIVNIQSTGSQAGDAIFVHRTSRAKSHKNKRSPRLKSTEVSSW